MSGRVRRFAAASVLVTGASRGLGRVLATSFACEGARVGIAYRSREEDANETLRLIQEAGGTGATVRMDVRSAESVREGIADFQREAPIDVLVSNAAIVHDRPLMMLSPDEWESVMATNLTGVYHCCRAVLPSMLARRRGAIVNVISVAALRAGPGQAAYAASKAAVLSLTRTLALEVAPYGVRVNAVAPGLLDTGMAARMNRQIAEKRAAEIPIGRVGTGREVADATLFLASDDASYVVGHCLSVDGGLSL